MPFFYDAPLVDESELEQARHSIGAHLPKIVGYFHEDGGKAILAIEKAMSALSAADMILPAHKLKGEARQLGAVRLGDIAEAIESTARTCVEKQSIPDDVTTEIAMLRGCFSDTMRLLTAAAQPVNAPASIQTRVVSSHGPALRAVGGRPTFGRRQS